MIARITVQALRRNCRIAHRFDGYTVRLCYPAIARPA